MSTLLVNEIYYTILGESSAVGSPCTIVRLTGCHRRCSYCDSAYAFTGGSSLALPEVLARVAGLGAGRVLVTGGEPLLQQACPDLLRALIADGRDVMLETSGTLGALSLAAVPDGVRRIVDVKTPASGIPAAQVDWRGLRTLGRSDELKFVCCDRADYDWARDLVRGGDMLPAEVPVAFSPAEGLLEPAMLAEWIIADKLDVRFQIQLQKVLWPGLARGI
ncbi:7-carboxy-7-deazaguanine synthase QueE [bacterium]|nr:7-carboxy-7-deazaguanine synthase QueE [bacterium]MBU1674920.1 7-carboxy-7-deazaguanine synthase QueE [bacterium]